MIKYIFILLLILSIGVGVYLATSDSSFFGKADESMIPEGIIISNVTDKSFTLTWFTRTPEKSLVTYGTGSNLSGSALDDRDREAPLGRKAHSTTLRNLDPDTIYLFKINGEGLSYEAKTAPSIGIVSSAGREYRGEAIIREGIPAKDAILYFKTEGGQLLSTVVRPEGGFATNTTGYRKQDLSAYSPVEFVQRVKFLVQSAEDGTGYLETLGGTNHPLKIFVQAKYIPFFKIQQGGLVREPSATSAGESTERETSGFFDWFWVRLN